MKRSLLTLALVALLSGCSATIEYHPSVGEPQLLKGAGGACDYEEGIEIWLKGAPSQPFTVIGYIDGQYTDGIGEEAALKRLLAEKVKEVSGSGVILTSISVYIFNKLFWTKINKFHRLYSIFAKQIHFMREGKLLLV